MGFFSFLGRVLFASIFILSAWQMDWRQVASRTSCISRQKFLVFFFIATLIAPPMGALFTFNEFGKDGGPAAKEWAPKLGLVKVFIERKIGKNNLYFDVKPLARTFVATSVFLKGFGGILFVLGSSFGAFLLIFYLILTTPILYDFYNYDIGEPKFFVLLYEFLQCVAFLGALLFFQGMKNSILRKQQKKKAPKPKAA